MCDMAHSLGGTRVDEQAGLSLFGRSDTPIPVGMPGCRRLLSALYSAVTIRLDGRLPILEKILHGPCWNI